MKKIVFMWSGTKYTGTIAKQEASSILGLKTEIVVSQPLKMKFTIFGKCEVGPCGPYNVISINNI